MTFLTIAAFMIIFGGIFAALDKEDEGEGCVIAAFGLGILLATGIIWLSSHLQWVP